MEQDNRIEELQKRVSKLEKVLFANSSETQCEAHDIIWEKGHPVTTTDKIIGFFGFILFIWCLYLFVAKGLRDGYLY